MFDPLHKWFGIPPTEQPPDDYRLLGVARFEDDEDVIDAAADKQLAFLHDLTNGEYGELAEELSNRVSAARLRLLNPKKKAAYDEQLLDEESEFESGLNTDANNSATAAAQAVIPTAPPAYASANPPAYASANPPANSPVPTSPPGSASTPLTNAGPVASATPVVAQPAATQSTASPRIRQRTPKSGRSSGSSSIFGGARFWWYAVVPGLFVIAILLGLIASGQLTLDANKLESMGMSSETAARIGEYPEKEVIVTHEVIPPKHNQTSSSPNSQATANGSNASSRATRSSSDAARSNPSAPTNPARTSGTGEFASTANRSESSSNNSPSIPSSPTTGFQPRHSANLGDLLNGNPGLAIPPMEQINAKKDVARDLYQKDYLAAKTVKAKQELAAKIQKNAKSTSGDPAGQFALWTISKDIFVAAGDFESACLVVDEMDERFVDIDAAELKSDVSRQD